MATRTGLLGSGGTGDADGTVLSAASLNKLAGGSVAYSDFGSDVTITTAADIGSITHTALTSRRYRVETMIGCRSTVANDVIRISITDSSNAVLALSEQAVPVANIFVVFHVVYRTNASAGSIQYKVRGSRSSGTGVVTAEPTAFAGANPGWIEVFDVSPNY